MMERPYIGPIPFSTIREKAKDYGSEADDFAFCIRYMDVTYLDIVRENPGVPRVDHSQTFGPEMMAGLG